MSGQPEMDVPLLAGFGRRIGGRVIDVLILVIVSVFLLVALGTEIDLEAGTVSVPLVARFALVVVPAAYEIYFVTTRGQTPGKIVARTQVVMAKSGEVPTIGAAAVRWAVPGLLALVPRLSIVTLLVYLWIIWDDRRQGLHDKAAGTIVVEASRV